MTDRSRVDDLMSELGPVLDPLQVIAYEVESTWALLFDEETLIVVEHDAEADRLVLSTDLGTPPEAARPALYDLLLRYNALWRASGGVRMALEESGGMVMLFHDLPVDGLDVTRLQATFTAFATTAGAWRRIVTSGGAGEAGATPAPTSTMDMLDPRFRPGVIRG